MQLHHANTLEIIDTVPWPVTLDRSDFSPSNRDEVLALLAPSGHSKPTIWLVAVALAGGFGLGWAGAWYAPATISALNPNTRIEPASRRMPDTKSGGKAESTRKIASAAISRTPPDLVQPSTVSANLAPKPLSKASGGAQSAEASKGFGGGHVCDRLARACGAAPVGPGDKTNNYWRVGSP